VSQWLPALWQPALLGALQVSEEKEKQRVNTGNYCTHLTMLILGAGCCKHNSYMSLNIVLPQFVLQLPKGKIVTTLKMMKRILWLNWFS
jgi:hypothetical protein